jgi:hypothetical protein
MQGRLVRNQPNQHGGAYGPVSKGQALKPFGPQEVEVSGDPDLVSWQLAGLTPSPRWVMGAASAYPSLRAAR